MNITYNISSDINLINKKLIRLFIQKNAPSKSNAMGKLQDHDLLSECFAVSEKKKGGNKQSQSRENEARSNLSLPVRRWRCYCRPTRWPGS